jgi:hypothetical protein
LIGQLRFTELWDIQLPAFVSLLIYRALLRQRIQFILHDPTVSARAIALQVVDVAPGALSPPNHVRNRSKFMGVQAKTADLRVRVQVRRIDGSDDRGGDLIPVQHHSRRNGGDIGVVGRRDDAKDSQ